jgi:hypothetical protein
MKLEKVLTVEGSSIFYWYQHWIGCMCCKIVLLTGSGVVLVSVCTTMCLLITPSLPHLLSLTKRNSNAKNFPVLTTTIRRMLS